MAVKIKDLTYWYREFRSLLSGWTPEEQIQFHQHAIKQLQYEIDKRGTSWET